MTTRLFLIRHGQVAKEWHGRVYGCLDVPLSPQGESEAELAAERLSSGTFAALVSSGLQRSRHGVRCLERCTSAARVAEDPDLRELDRGRWAGLTFDELERVEPGAWSAWAREPGRRRPPGGESLQDLSKRVVPRLFHWARVGARGDPEREDQVALVLHLWVIRVAICAAMGMDLDLAPRLALPTGGMVILDWPAREPLQTNELTRAGQASVGERAHIERPVLAGFAMDRPPDSGRGWFRGPRVARR